MSSEEPNFVDVKALRVGLYVELDMGWMSHPFPTGSFKITTARQIETIRGLGIPKVRFFPEKSDPPPDESAAIAVATLAQEQAAAAQRLLAQQEQVQRQRAEQLSAQQRSLLVCERRFGEAIRQYKKTLELLRSQPKQVAEQCQSMVNGFVGEMLVEGESAIRLLTEAAGDKASMHPVNVTIVSLLLGKAMGMAEEELVELGTAAFLHDIGKQMLPERVRWLEENFSTAEYKLYQEHVSQGLEIISGMGLSRSVQLTIAQHHEMADGSGYPARIRNDAMTPAARVLSLVNRYDSLCNPSRPAAAMTPHEALSMIFAQQKTRFDAPALSAFIRMVGVYPPGSVVQLVDERYAMVVSVNSARPLKPRIIVHEPGTSRHDALILDLEKEPHVGIRRSVKPMALPSAAMDFLAPRQRVNYFFEAVQEPIRSAVGV